MGAESDLESALTRGANHSMARLFTSVCWYSCEHCGLNMREGPHLAIVENNTETSRNRFEWRVGI